MKFAILKFSKSLKISTIIKQDNNTSFELCAKNGRDKAFNVKGGIKRYLGNSSE